MIYLGLQWAKHLKLVGNSSWAYERHTQWNMINWRVATCCRLLLPLLLPQKFVAAFNNCASLSAAVNLLTSCPRQKDRQRGSLCPHLSLSLSLSAALGCCCQYPAALLFVLCQALPRPGPGYKLLYGTFGSLTKLKMPDNEMDWRWNGYYINASQSSLCSRPIIRPHWSLAQLEKLMGNEPEWQLPPSLHTFQL